MASLTECKCFGMVDDVHSLANLLRSFSYNYEKVVLHEVVLKVPLQQGNPTTIKLSHRLPGSQNFVGAVVNPLREPAPERWTLKHEGASMKGPAYNDLPAALREVTEATCYSNTTPEFWQMLGAKFDYELHREGNEYHILFKGHNLKASLVRLSTLPEPGKLENIRGTAKYIFELSCKVPEGQQVEGARALEAFGHQLHPLVTLSRAEA